MGKREKLDKKLKRYRTILSDYHHALKELDQDLKDERVSKEKFRKKKAKLELKKKKVIHKMHTIREKFQGGD